MKTIVNLLPALLISTVIACGSVYGMDDKDGEESGGARSAALVAARVTARDDVFDTSAIRAKYKVAENPRRDEAEVGAFTDFVARLVSEGNDTQLIKVLSVIDTIDPDGVLPRGDLPALQQLAKEIKAKKNNDAYDSMISKITAVLAEGDSDDVPGGAGGERAAVAVLRPPAKLPAAPLSASRTASES